MKPLTKLITHTTVTLLTVTLTLLYTSCDKPKIDNETLDSKRFTERPREIISLPQAIDMYTEYGKKRVPYIEEVEITDANGDPFKATRSLFFDYDRLKQYLAYIEQQASKRDIKISGLRFYFAKYPEDAFPSTDARVKYPKRQTFFVAPTALKKINNRQVNAGFTLDQNGKMLLLSEVLNKKGKGLGLHTNTKTINEASIANFFNWTTTQNEYSLIANEMQTSPPNGVY